MVGFSRAINKLSQSQKWDNPDGKTQKRKKSQTGAGKISKKRHITVDVKKCKKQSKKQKTRH